MFNDKVTVNGSRTIDHRTFDHYRRFITGPLITGRLITERLITGCLITGHFDYKMRQNYSQNASKLLYDAPDFTGVRQRS